MQALRIFILTVYAMMSAIGSVASLQRGVLEEVDEYVRHREQTIKQLLDVIAQQPKDLYAYLRWRKAVRLLGQLRAVEATGLLLEQIANVSLTSERTLETLYPTVGALIPIGYPSVRAILNQGFRKERSDLEQKLMAHVIRNVLGYGARDRWEVGTRLGRLVIQEHLHSAKPPAPVRERLTKFMEKYFPEKRAAKH